MLIKTKIGSWGLFVFVLDGRIKKKQPQQNQMVVIKTSVLFMRWYFERFFLCAHNVFASLHLPAEVYV